VPAGPPVLFLTHRVPYPPDKGDRIRTYHLLRQMATRGRVWLGCLADEPVEPATRAALADLCERVEIVPVRRFGRWARGGVSLLTGGSLSEGAFFDARLARTVRAWAAETGGFAAAVASASSLAPYFRHLRGTPAVFDMMDVDSQKWLDFADATGGPKRLLYRLEAARVRKIERAMPGWVRAVGLVSRAEVELFDKVVGTPFATVATNGVDLDYFRPTAGPTEPACVFVGALDYLPNVDAAVWFADAAWPLIRERRPDAEFWLVGRKPAPAVAALAARPGVKLVGQVPDVRPYLERAAVVVSPLRLARGIQNKVLEAMAAGKPTIASPAALQALRAEPGVHVLSANTPAEWADAVTGLLGDPDRRRELGDAGRRFVEEHHHWERCLEPILAKIFG
jgi:sugar transferase (PEP-CTERM/EpsH1 system associated)